MGEHKTLPTWCLVWGHSLDLVRLFLRRNPALAVGAVVVGPTKTYPQEVAERIRVAFEASRKKPREFAAV